MSRLLTMENLVVEGFQEDKWGEIVHRIDVHIDRGEVLGLIGESGAGKSTIGIASMGFCRPGCRIAAGTITFEDTDLAADLRRHPPPTPSWGGPPGGTDPGENHEPGETHKTRPCGRGPN